MNQKQRNQEWQDILDLAKHNASLGRWLEARQRAHDMGDRTNGYTFAIRKEYRAIIRGDYA